MDEMPSMTSVFKWLRIHEEFAQQYAMAKDASADALADEIVDIADDRQDDPDAASRRVRIDARKWVASKLKPKRYGDRIEQEVKVTTSIEEVLSRRLGRITE
jgi:hypothetical protein